MKKQGIAIVCVLFMGILLFGCGKKVDKEEKIKDLEFTVVSDDELPEELKTSIESQKENPFRFTYEEAGYLYICAGYGKQPTGGYCITVDEVYETENAIYMDSNLMGPTDEDAKGSAASYPYVVIKLELVEKAVVFQ